MSQSDVDHEKNEIFKNKFNKTLRLSPDVQGQVCEFNRQDRLTRPMMGIKFFLSSLLDTSWPTV